jgi:S1-C subfamily serine protease
VSRSWWVVFIGVVLASCGGISPHERAAVITHAGCGDGFDGEVAAMVVGPELAVTVAHGVAQADSIEVHWGDARLPARVVAYSSRTDLALVAAPGLEADPVAFGAPKTGSEVRMVGGLASGALPLVVEGTPTIRIEEVLGTDRVEREGVELAGEAADGDSGAGLFDRGDALVGLVFAVSDDGSGEVWATASSEIIALMAETERDWRCDAARSRLVDAGQG